MKDVLFLSKKSVDASKDDINIGIDLMDTLKAHKSECVGMAANMIGFNKRIIIVNMGLVDVLMFNPKVIKKSMPYEIMEGCLSLSGQRKTTRYQNIELEYYDMNFKKHHEKFSGYIAQIIEHELDHLEGIII